MASIKDQVKALLEQNKLAESLELLKGKVDDIQYESTLILLVNRCHKLTRQGLMDLSSSGDQGREGNKIVYDILGLMDTHLPEESAVLTTSREACIADYEKAAKRTDIVRYLAQDHSNAETLNTLKTIHQNTLGHRQKYTKEVLYELLDQGFVARAKVKKLTTWNLTPEGRKALYRLLVN